MRQCFSVISVAGWNILTTANSREKGLLQFTVLGYSPPLWCSQCRSLKLVTFIVKSRHACMLCSDPLYTYVVQEPNPENGATHSRLGLPRSVIVMKRNPLQACTVACLIQAVPRWDSLPGDSTLCEVDGYKKPAQASSVVYMKLAWREGWRAGGCLRGRVLA